MSRHLYFLAAALLLGAFLGPACLGRLRPVMYDRIFTGSGDTAPLLLAQEELTAYTRFAPLRQAQQVAEMKVSGATPVAAQELAGDLQDGFAKGLKSRQEAVSAEAKVIRDNQAARARLLGLIRLGVLAALFLVMAAEAALPLGARGPALADARYGLASLWLLLAMAAPGFLGLAAHALQ